MSASPEASTSALPASDAAGSSAAAAASTSARKPLALRPKKAKAGPSPGIVYISRIPPGMTPHKIKHLMSRWGETGKVFAQKDEAGVKGGKGAFG
jgi:ESF2/ABP1 family protein